MEVSVKNLMVNMNDNEDIREYEARTDLALEANENIQQKNETCNGIKVYKEFDEKSGLKITCIDITDKQGEKALGRPIGRYITAENMQLTTADEELQSNMAEKISSIIREMLSPYLSIGSPSVLVVGLGNKEVTPDCLGPLVTDYISVLNYGEEDNNAKINMTAIAPGVMAQTGMETALIVKGIVEASKPDAVIAVDALAARSSARLNTTVQLSNRGIHPGSGVGNHRTGITEQTVGVPVIAIGIPTVIEAATIVGDAVENFTASFAASDIFAPMDRILKDMTEEEKRKLMLEVIDPVMSEMYVTPRDVDASVRRVAYIMAQAIDKLVE